MAEASDKPAAPSGGARLARALPQVVVLAALWVLFSGKFDPLHLSYGVISIALVLVLTPHLAQRVEHGPGRGASDVSALAALRPGKAIVYPLWLLWQIVLANIQVAGLILQPKPRIAPLVIRFRFPVPLRVAKMALGNSITLTPGTFTVRVRGDVFVVHAITREAAASLLSGEMQQRVAAVFGHELSGAAELELRHRFDTLDGNLEIGDEPRSAGDDSGRSDGSA